MRSSILSLRSVSSGSPQTRARTDRDDFRSPSCDPCGHCRWLCSWLVLPGARATKPPAPRRKQRRQPLGWQVPSSSKPPALMISGPATCVDSADIRPRSSALVTRSAFSTVRAVKGVRHHTFIDPTPLMPPYRVQRPASRVESKFGVFPQANSPECDLLPTHAVSHRELYPANYSKASCASRTSFRQGGTQDCSVDLNHSYVTKRRFQGA